MRIKHLSHLVSLCWLLVLGLLWACSSETPMVEDRAPTKIEKSAQDNRDYRYLELDNGLRAVLVRDDNAETAAVSLSINAGSYQNPEAFPGLAHYLEHMLFLGTEKYPEPNAFQEFVEANAGRANAYTARDHTNYYFQLVASELDPALDRFSDYFKAPLFDPEYRDKERSAVHHEWSMGKSQDSRILQHLMGLTADPEHPAADFHVGNRDTLPAGDDSGLQQALEAFYQRYYSANLMTLAMVSPQSLGAQEALVQKHFGGIPSREVDAPVIEQPALTPDHQGKHIYYKPQQDIKEMLIEFPLKDNTDQWRLKPNRYLHNLLSSEDPGTLGHYLREENLVNSLTVSVVPDFYGADGILRINLDLTEQGLKQQERIIAASLSYLNLIKTRGVTKDYFEEFRHLAKNNFDNWLAPQPLQQAVHLSSQLRELPPAYINSANYTYERFDPEAINTVLNQLTPQSMRIWHINQSVETDTDIPFYEGSYRVTAITEQERETWQQEAKQIALKLPQKNTLASGERQQVEHNILDMTQLVDDEGLEVWFQHAEHHRDGKGYLHFVLNNDLGLNNERDLVLGNLLNQVLQEQNLSLIDRAGRAGISMSLETTQGNMQNFTLSGPADNHQILAKAVFDSIAKLEINQKAFDKARDSFRERIANEDKQSPSQQIWKFMARTTHPYDWNQQKILATIDELEPRHLQAYLDQVKQKSLLRVYAFGHYLPEQIEDLARYAEAKLGTGRSPVDEVHVDPIVTPKPGQMWARSKTIRHSDVGWLDLYVLPEQNDRILAEFQLLSNLVNNPMYTQLRSEEQIGYSLGAGGFPIGDYPAFMFMVQSSDHSLADIHKRVDRFRRDYLPELEALDAQVVDQLRASTLAQLTQTPNNFEAEATRKLRDFYRNNSAFDSREKLIAALEQITKDDLVSTYKNYLLGDATGRLLLQMKGTNFKDSEFAQPGD